MKQAILYGAGDLRIEERPLDPASIEADQVYVKTEVTAFSTGTDLGNYLGKSTEVPGAPDYPRPVGYSNIGRVVAAGSAVKCPRVGELVFAPKPHQSAYIARITDLLVPIPAGVSPEQASLAYLTQLGLAAIHQARYEAGESIAVVGLGVIGLCAIGLARALGAKAVGIANSPLRLEKARSVGANAVMLATDVHGAEDLRSVVGSSGVDIVILTANTWDAYRLSVEMVRDGGRVSILGFPGRGQAAPGFNPLDPRWLYQKQIALIGAGKSTTIDCAPGDLRFNLRRNLELILELMASGKLALEVLISHRFHAEKMNEAYELASSHAKELTAAIFDWRNIDS